MSKDESQSRLDAAVPSPQVSHLDEDEKKALELSAEVEHADGRKRSELSQQATELADPEAKG